MIDKLFGIAGSALNAQLTRMNATASNLANAGTVAPTEAEAYRARRPVFKAVVDSLAASSGGSPSTGGVRVERLIDDPAPVRRQFDPGNPMAGPDGFLVQSNVNEVSEMVDMMAAARSYQNNVETVNTAKQLMLRTVELLRN